MSLVGAYDPDNIFAKILCGDIPAARVFENDSVCAFLDAFPQADGHTLVVPKGVQARNLLDCPSAHLSGLMETTQRVGRAIVAALAPDGLALMQFNGASAGQTVFYPHIHLIPRRAGQPLPAHGSNGMADMTVLRKMAVRIARHGEGDGFAR